jgi:hypothetical protein
MNAPDPQPTHLLITPASRRPSTAEVKSLLARLGVGEVSGAAVDQLIGAMSAANRWLADRPEEAVRFLEDPAAALEAMQAAGVITGSMADLLAVLRSLRKRGEGALKARARVVRVLRPATASFGRKPELRFGAGEYEEYDQSDEPGGR